MNMVYKKSAKLSISWVAGHSGWTRNPKVGSSSIGVEEKWKKSSRNRNNVYIIGIQFSIKICKLNLVSLTNFLQWITWAVVMTAIKSSRLLGETKWRKSSGCNFMPSLLLCGRHDGACLPVPLRASNWPVSMILLRAWYFLQFSGQEPGTVDEPENGLCGMIFRCHNWNLLVLPGGADGHKGWSSQSIYYPNSSFVRSRTLRTLLYKLYCFCFFKSNTKGCFTRNLMNLRLAIFRFITLKIDI